MQIWLNYLDQIMILAAFALSLNLLLGYTGHLSVGTPRSERSAATRWATSW